LFIDGATLGDVGAPRDPQKFVPGTIGCNTLAFDIMGDENRDGNGLEDGLELLFLGTLALIDVS
jgi:hypothetical protein